MLSALSLDAIAQLKSQVQKGEAHPKQAKVNLAKEIVTRFHSAQAAQEAAEEFDKLFKKKEIPDEIEAVSLPASSAKKSLAQLIAEQGMAASNSEARRLIGQGGVSLSGERYTESTGEILMKGEYLLKVGKRKFKKIIFS